MKLLVLLLIFGCGAKAAKDQGIALAGKDGKDGEDGQDGAAGKDGTNGKDGANGSNGIDNHVVQITYCSGTLTYATADAQDVSIPNTGLDFRDYKNVFSSGDVLVIGSIAGPGAQIANSMYYAKGQPDAESGLLVLDQRALPGDPRWELSYVSNIASFAVRYFSPNLPTIGSRTFPFTDCTTQDY